MNNAFLAGGLALLLGVTATAQSEDRNLQATGERALRAVEKHLGVELKTKLTFREAKKSELRDILNKELVKQFEAQFEDPKKAETERKNWVRSMAQGILAKYAFGSGNVMVIPDTIGRVATLIDEPKLATNECLQAILVHECVHVIADQEHQFAKHANTLGNTDELLAYNAVIEGHAQFIARKVCAENGWSEGFEIFTKSIGKVPDLGDEAENMLARVAAVSASWAYYQGEEFIAALHAAGGDKAIAKAYAEPPKSPAQVFHPDWYLDPDKQPTITYPIDEGFDAFEKTVDKKKWTVNKMTINEAQISTAMQLLAKDDIDRCTKHLQVCKSLIVTWTRPAGERMISAAVFVSDSVSEAAFFLACEERLMRKKDEAMKAGPMKIVDSKYTQKGEGAMLGLLAQKVIQYRGQDLPVTTLVLAQDRVVLELTYSNEAVTEEEIVKKGRELLGNVLKRPDENDGKDEKKGK